MSSDSWNVFIFMQKVEVVSRELRDQMELNRHLKEQVRSVLNMFLCTYCHGFLLHWRRPVNTLHLCLYKSLANSEDIFFWSAVGVASWK